MIKIGTLEVGNLQNASMPAAALTSTLARAVTHDAK